MTMTLQARHGHLHGELTLPKTFTEVASGHFEGVAPQNQTVPVTSRVANGKVTLVAGFEHERDMLEIAEITPDRLSLQWASGMVPDWVFQRAPSVP